MPRPSLDRLARALACLLACEAEVRSTDARDAPATTPARTPASAPEPTITAADFTTAMAEGRDAFAREDYPLAVAAFERALLASPDDPRALSELGWAALHAGDLPRAEGVLERAVADAREPRLVAASLYNLGRVREAQDRPTDAIALYERSLELRDSRTVRARLGRVRSTPAKAELDLDLLEGPFDDPTTWCARAVPDTAGFTRRCDTMLVSRPGLVIEQARIDATEGLLEAEFVATNEPGSNFVHHHLAVRTDAGWFVRPNLATDGDAGNARAELSHLAFELVDVVPAGGVELMVRVDETWTDRGAHPGVTHEDQRSDRLLCGVGPSGRPACTSPIPLSGALRERGGEEQAVGEQRWRMSLVLGKRAVRVGGEASAVDAAHRVWLGEHAIGFP